MKLSTEILSGCPSNNQYLNCQCAINTNFLMFSPHININMVGNKGSQEETKLEICSCDFVETGRHYFLEILTLDPNWRSTKEILHLKQ